MGVKARLRRVNQPRRGDGLVKRRREDWDEDGFGAVRAGTEGGTEQIPQSNRDFDFGAHFPGKPAVRPDRSEHQERCN